MTDGVERTLCEAIWQAASDRHRRDAWLVYGDWLQTQGDRRGELIAHTYGARTFSERAEARRLEAGANAEVARRASGTLRDQLTVANGFIVEVGGVRTLETLARLAKNPDARFLQRLWCPLQRDITDETSLARTLASASFAPGLRQLTVSDVAPIALGEVFAACPELRAFQGGPVGGQRAHHGQLRELSASLPQGSVVAQRALLSSLLVPKLTHLTLFHLQAQRLADTLTRLVAGPQLAALEVLRLEHCSGVDTLLALLAPSPLAPRLRRIEVRHSDLGPNGVAALVRNPHRFAALTSAKLTATSLASGIIDDVARAPHERAWAHDHLVFERELAPSGWR